MWGIVLTCLLKPPCFGLNFKGMENKSTSVGKLVREAKRHKMLDLIAQGMSLKEAGRTVGYKLPRLYPEDKTYLADRIREAAEVRRNAFIKMFDEMLKVIKKQVKTGVIEKTVITKAGGKIVTTKRRQLSTRDLVALARMAGHYTPSVKVEQEEQTQNIGPKLLEHAKRLAEEERKEAQNHAKE